MTSALRTWIDLAGCLDPDDLVAVADFMLSGDRPLSSPSELRSAARQSIGRRGAPALRRAAALARDGVESRMESLLRMLVVDAGLPEAVPNADVRNPEGVWVARSDLVFVDYRVVLEYEGKHHWADGKRFVDDIDRRDRIERAGWKVVQVAARHLLEHRAHTIARITRALRERGWDG